MKLFLVLLLSVSLVFGATAPLNSIMVSGNNHFLANSTTTFDAGSTVNFNGVFNVTATSGTVNLTNVTKVGFGTGSVSSVAMTVPSILSVAGSPITSSGTLALTLANQNANIVLAGPATGVAAAPTFRALVAADLPSGTGNVTANGTLTSGHFIGGGGTNIVGPTNITFSGNDVTVPGDLTVNGALSLANLTTVTLNVTGNITSAGLANGTLLIGNATSGNFVKNTLTAGANVTITNTAGTITISATGNGTGNVTGTGALTAGNVIVGAGVNSIAASNVTISGNNIVVPGNTTTDNLTVTNNLSLANLTTATLNVTGNFTSPGLANGTLLIGNATSGNFAKSTLTAGDNIVITNTAGAITINATSAGTVTSSSSSSGQAAQFSSATNIVGVNVVGTGNYTKDTSPTFVTPILGVATATSLNNITVTAPASAATLTLAAGKTFTLSNTTTLAGTDGSTLNIGAGGTLGTAAYTAATAYEVPLTFSTGLTRSTNTVTVNSTQAITKLSTLTTNGYVTTSGSDGTLGITVPTTVGGSFVGLTNPSAITFPRINADNSVSALDAASYRTAIGAGTGGGNVTAPSALTANVVLVGNGTTVAGAIASIGNSGAPLLSAGAGAPPAFGALNLAGGSNIVTGAVPVANGGTGLATLTANNVMIGNGTNTVAFVAPGTSGNVLTSNGTAWASAAAAGGGTKTLARWQAQDMQPPNSLFATFGTRNSVAFDAFDDTTAWFANFLSVIPQAADFTTGITVRIFWTAATATSGAVVWSSAFEKCTTDIDSDSFATAVTATTTTSGTSGIPNVTTIDHSGSQIDSVAAGDMFRLQISRVAGDGADTMTGNAQILAVEIQQR